MEAKALVDYLLVVGLNPQQDLDTHIEIEKNAMKRSPLRRPYQAHCLAHYPQAPRPWFPDFDPNAVVLLCFPRGLHFKRHNDNRRIKFHTFVLTKDDGSRVYGANLIFYETVDDPKLLMAMAMLESMHQQQLAHDTAPTRSGRLSMVARDILPPEFDPKRDKLYAPKSLCLLSTLPAVACFERYIRQLYLLSQSELATPSVPRCIQNLLFEVPLPPPGKTMIFGGTEPIVLQRPSRDALPMFQYSMRRMFSLFETRLVVQLVTCALLEQQIILRSSDYELLVLVAECFTTLMYPFLWQHVYVPILPSTALHFIEAPVPFIMGLHTEVVVDSPTEACCLVDIDQGSVTLPEDVPVFPGTAALVDKLNKLVKESSESSGCANLLQAGGAKGLHGLLSGTTMPPLPNNPGTAEDFHFNADVRNVFLNAWKEALKGYESYVIVPENGASWLEGSFQESVFDALAFLSDQPRPNLPFLSAFLETQIFAAFIDNKLTTLLTQPNVVTCFDRVMGSQRKLVSTDDLPPEEPVLLDINAPAEVGDNPVNTDFTCTMPWQSPLSRRRRSDTSQKAAARKLPQRPSRSSPDVGPSLPTPGLSTSSSITPPDSPLKVAFAPVALNPEDIKCGARPFALPDAAAIHLAEHVTWPTLTRRASFASITTPSHAPPQPATSASAKGTPHRTRRVSDTSGIQLDGNSLGAASHGALSGLAASHGLSSGPASGIPSVTRPSYNAPKHLRDAKQLADQVNVGNAMATDSADSQERFATALINECSARVKKIIVVMMASTVNTATLTETGVGVENTLVAGLCDLMERMWRHGLAVKSQSALWTFLSTCSAMHREVAKQQAALSASQQQQPQSQQAQQPQPPSLEASTSLNSSANSTAPPVSSTTQGASLSRSHSTSSSSRVPPAHSPPFLSEEAVAEVDAIERMSFLHTDLGRGRAWIRLCLEKKCLSARLEEALRCEDVIQKMYREYAFLRHPEYYVQLVGHLLSLTTVDFHSFSCNYPPAEVTYRLRILTSKGFRAGTSANVTVSVVGDHGVAGPYQRGRSATFNAGGLHEFDFKVNNLGPLQAVELSHDGSGLSPSWTVDRVFLTNMLTSRTYEFVCGQRLVKEGDQPCKVRLAVHVPKAQDAAGSGSNGTDEVDLPPGVEAEMDLLAEEFASSVNAIVQHFFSAGAGIEHPLPPTSSTSSSQPPASDGSGSPSADTAGHTPAGNDGLSVDTKATLLLGRHRLATRAEVEHLSDLGFLLAGDGNSLNGRSSRRGSQSESHPASPAQEGLCQALRKVFRHGYKTRTLFGPERHVWDFIDRAHQQMRQARNSPDPDGLFYNKVEQANAMQLPKAARFEWFICSGASARVLHVWLELASAAAKESDLYTEHALLRQTTRVRALSDMLRFLVEFKFDLPERILYVPAEKGLGHWALRATPAPGETTRLMSAAKSSRISWTPNKHAQNLPPSTAAHSHHVLNKSSSFA